MNETKRNETHKLMSISVKVTLTEKPDAINKFYRAIKVQRMFACLSFTLNLN